MLARLTSGAEGMLVLSAEKLRADHPLAKEGKERGVLVGCRRLYDSPPSWDPDPRKAELVQWCAARAKVMGVPLDLSEAAYVVAATGNQLAGKGWGSSIASLSLHYHFIIASLSLHYHFIITRPCVA